MSLKKCIKVTANLDNADVVSVLESFDGYKDSMEQDEAARLAIDDALTSIKQERKEYLQLFNETYPNALKEAGQKPDLTPLPKPKPAPKQAEKLEDVGEKIGGARKDVWSGFREKISVSVSDEEILRLPLSKLFPEPNYQKLAEQGVSPKSLSIVKVIRDEIPAKGQTNWKRRKYLDAVKLFKETSERILENESFAETYTTKMREQTKYNLAEIADRIDLMVELGFPTNPISLKGVRFGMAHFSLYNGEKNVDKWIVDITSKSAKSLGGMGGTIAATNTREEAVTALKKYLADAAAKPKKKKGATEFIVYKYRRDDGRKWIIGKKIGKNYYDMKEGFEDQTKAREYVTGHQDELEAQLKKYKEIPKLRKDANEVRLGEDYRGGKDATAKEFKDAFGFRGVEFGNWVEQGKRQQDVNEAYDGLMDMAKILGIPPKAIALNGELGMAFGARGTGGLDPAKAHYEPDKIVINLTKKSGAGSLAHEWFHALDNYFSRMRGAALSHVTDQPYALTNKAVRQEMLDRFKGIMTAIRATGMPDRAAKLDAKKAKDYYGIPTEMGARTFESYIIGKLKEAETSNDYLANIISPEYWAAAEGLGLEAEGSYPYVIEEEMKPVAEAYEALFEAIKTKETEQGTALYSKRPANIDARGNPLVGGDFVQRDDPILTQPKRNVSAEALTKLVNNIQISNQGTRAITFHIRATQEEAFGVNSVAENGIIKGGFYSGTNEIVLIAENIKDINDAMSVIRHEAVGHYGLRQLLNKEGEYDKLLDRVYEARSDELKEQYDWVAKAYPEIVAQNDVRKIADEMLAHAAETKTKSNLLTKIYDAIIKLLNKLGLVLDTVSHREVNALIRLSEANLRKDIRPQVYQQESAFRADDVAPDMFYSQLENHLAEKLPKSGTSKQFKDTIAAFARKGQIKAEELEWSGVNEWLDEQAGKVSKNDVIDFIRANRIRVDEVVKGGVSEEAIDTFLSDEAGEGYSREEARDYLGEDEGTKFADYQLPGGEQYRELLLTLPQKKAEPQQLEWQKNSKGKWAWFSGDSQVSGAFAEYDARNAAMPPPSTDDFKGGHYDEPNVLAHIRFNERTDADGKKVLFVEEIQSDWHQSARKKGYKGKVPTDKEVRNFFGLDENVDAGEYRDEMMEHGEYTKGAVPDAPFKTTWPLLAMKRVIRHAAENGFDKIAWTTGSQQAERYDLSKQIEELKLFNHGDGNWDISAIQKGGGLVDIASAIPESKLEENIGKDLAKKAVETQTERGWHTYSGLDLKVGGEGMKGFYDNILPKTVNKYVKKWGGKVGETSFDIEESKYVIDAEDISLSPQVSQEVIVRDRNTLDGVHEPFDNIREAEEWIEDQEDEAQLPVHSLDITDKMRTAVMEGQPLFAKKLMDANDPTILFSKAADDASNAPVSQSLGMPEEGRKDLFVRLAQDSFNRIKTMQEAILKKGGEIRTESDVYLAEERSSSIISYELKAFEKKYQKPLIDLMGDKNLEPEEVDLYVIAKHAPERNEYIASINDDMQDGGSGMTTQQSKDILAEFESKRTDLEAAAQIIYDANNQTLDTLVKEGHMKEEVANELRERWDYYVPLKGKDGEDYRMGTGVGYNITGLQFKHPMGRGEGNLPESPTAHSFAQAETAIVRTEKSRIGKALVELVRANPDPDFWSIGQRTYKQFEDLYGTPFEGYENEPPEMVNNIDYKKVMGITPEERIKAKAEGRKPKAKAVYKLDRNYKHRPDVFGVMVEGEEILIKIEDRIVMEQLTKANATQLNAIVRGFGKVNRYLAMVNTGLNLEFVLGNFERDIQTALIHLSGEQSAKLALKVTKGVPSAMRGIWQGVFDTKGKSKYRQLWDEMQSEGGAIGFFGLEDIETKVKHLQNKLKRKHGVLGTTKRGVLLARDLILDANLAVENGVRLSAYKEVRDALIANGMPATDAKAKAATISKNLTVNFNRKGEWAPVFNSLWLFSSVSIQGSFRIMSSIAKHKRTRKIVAGIATAAFFNALYNAGAGDDDDGIPYWDKISEYEKQTNMIFMHPDGDNEVGTGGGGRYFKVRMPYGYNVFWYTGLATHNAAFNPRATLPKMAMNMLDAVLNAYNPIQGADLLDTITPTIAKPFEQDKRNINFMGGNIRPDYIFDQYDRPSSQKFFGSTNKYLVDAFVDLNELTGGDETHPGWWDWSPQTVKHYTGWLTGGAGMFAERVISGGVNLATGEEIETRNIPFIRSMTGTPSARFDSDRYYEALKQVAAVKAQLKIHKGTDKWSEYRQENYQVNRLSFKAKVVKKQIRRLREQRDKAYENDDRYLAKEKTEEIRLKMMDFSMKYDEAIEAQE